MTDISVVDGDPVTRSASTALALAAERSVPEAEPDDLLAGLLLVLSRFGIVWVGERALDLEALGVRWPSRRRAANEANGASPKIAYSAATAEVFDRAAGIARRDGARRTEAIHLLAAYAGESRGLMGEIKRRYRLTAADWRAELARTPRRERTPERPQAAQASPTKGFFTPDEAAEFLGLHIQTVRGYVRSGKLPASRVAGERAIRIQRQDLLGLLEPVEQTVDQE